MFYLDVFRQLDEKRVRYVLVGGLAINLHGVPRLTSSVDLLLAPDTDNMRALLAIADTLVLQVGAPGATEDMSEAGGRRSWMTERALVALTLRSKNADDPLINVLLDQKERVDEALMRAECREVGGATVRLAAIDDLIRLKHKARRPQDLADVVHLYRLQQKGLKLKHERR